MKKNNVYAIIPAAGSSSRFGNENKLLLCINGKTIIRRVIETIIESDIKYAVVVTGCYRTDIENIIISEKIGYVYNTCWESGMGCSISAGMKFLSKKFDLQINDGIMIQNADMPFVKTATVNLIIKYFFESDKLITAPKFKNITGHPVIFNTIFSKELSELSGDHGGKKIIKSQKDKICFVKIQSNEIIADIDYKNFS